MRLPAVPLPALSLAARSQPAVRQPAVRQPAAPAQPSARSGAFCKALAAIAFGGLLHAAPAVAAPDEVDPSKAGGEGAEARRARRKAEPSVQERYDEGLKALKRGYYVRALEEFNQIRNLHRDDPLAVKSELAIADVYFKKADWAQARLAYEDFMRWHPRSEQLDYVVWQLGLTMYKDASKVAARDQTWTRAAVDTWSGFGRRFPDSAHKEEAEAKLAECSDRLARKELGVAKFYVRRKAWVAVEGRARGLVTLHPDSAHVPASLALLAEAHAWQGEAAQAEQALEALTAKDPELADRARERVGRAKPPEELPSGGTQ